GVRPHAVSLLRFYQPVAESRSGVTSINPFYPCNPWLGFQRLLARFSPRMIASSSSHWGEYGIKCLLDRTARACRQIRPAVPSVLQELERRLAYPRRSARVRRQLLSPRR